ncbi:MAG: 4-hydroxy-3-methylbut-2-en-1-yl diphosphate synthase [Sphingobacteriales bacterium]|nr:MAG: 4-hydroxy-3-methylbut-2-en-1-yl diphosphate synthase [Sphingobacteriales bacterium]
MLQQYCTSLTEYKRLPTKEVKIGHLTLGNFNPIRIQTMTTTDTMDTVGTVAQSIRCIEAGAELVRITAPSKKEAENLLLIKNELRRQGYDTPLVADIHFTPNAAEIAARIVEKVRVNPGNYVDKKKFDVIDYTDLEYAAEIDRIRERFTPLVKICKEYGTAMRIGTNHGSLSDRIMSRYGDTPIGMVESAMEFLRIARSESYHQIILSMKSSNPQVMVQAYRLLVQKMEEEFGECYPLHLGVTEAGDGEDGRIKSAIGIGTLLEDGIGDTIRVSLTEDPEFEIPVCKDLVRRYNDRNNHQAIQPFENKIALPYNPFSYQRRQTIPVGKAGSAHVPVVVADFSNEENIAHSDLEAIGYRYDEATDKWNIGDAAADYIYTSNTILDFALPGTLQVICNYTAWQTCGDKSKYHPLLTTEEYLDANINDVHFARVDANADWNLLQGVIAKAKTDEHAILCIYSSNQHTMPSIRRFVAELMLQGAKCPIILQTSSDAISIDEQLIALATDAGGLLLEGMGDGVWLQNTPVHNIQMTGRTYLAVSNNHQFISNTAFSILQATRTRISKTEYISCPSCGRTLFDLQETTAKIRNATSHLKGVKIAIMGCIVNGPGEMADADFGYVGSGPGKITLYKSKDVVKKNVPSEIAVDELIQLLKDNDAWVEPTVG